MLRHLRAVLVTSVALLWGLGVTAQSTDTQWPTYGGDAGGQRFTTSTQITPDNVAQLQVAWTFHTGDLMREPGASRFMAFEATPILYGDTLYLGTPYDNIVALDPATGKQRWVFDSHLSIDPLNLLTTRGVAAWPQLPTGAGPQELSKQRCTARIFIATLDRRLLAVDVADGHPCIDFGNHGTVDLSRDVFYKAGDRYGVTSAPTVVGDAVIVGSMVPDNHRVDIESGLVRAFDVRSGKQLWSWEPLPWARQQTLRTGAGNAWSTFAADLERGIVYVPTGAPSPDFYGGMRPGDNRDANSVVALDAKTGRRLWGFQVVHHDVWDYDVAAEPLLFTWHGPDGKQDVPAIAINTKQGLVFLLNRLTGEPLFPIDEKPVPQSDVPGEHLSATQPFQRIDSVSPITLDLNQPLGTTPAESKYCRTLLSSLRYEGIYTPPSLQGSLDFPGNLGGVNWGSASFDPQTGILYANTNRYAYSLTLLKRHGFLVQHLLDIPEHGKWLAIAFAVCLVLFIAFWILRKRRLAVLALVILAGLSLLLREHFLRHPRTGHPAIRSAEHFGREIGPQTGTPYIIQRLPLIVPEDGFPCVPQPWGTVSSLNLNTGKTVWQTPLGTLLAGKHTGTVNLGGDVLTASGLLFTGASENPYLRAFDSATGRQLWQARLPAPAQATPMSYTYRGRQYVVIAAGGHSLFGTPLNDTLVAFALPEAAAPH